MTLSNKKIFVVCFSGNSGLTDYSVSLCAALATLCDLTFITSKLFNAETYHVNFKVKRLFGRSRYYFVDIFKFLFVVIKNKPDVVLFQSWLKLPLCETLVVSVLNVFGIKTAITIHDLLPHDPQPWSQFILSRFYTRFSAVIVHSIKTQNALRAMKVYTDTLVVPHGSYDVFRRDQLSRGEALSLIPEVKEQDFVALFFGYLDPRKGILEFLKASELLKEYSNIKLLVAGQGGGKGIVAETCEYYRKAENVILHDRRIPFAEVQHYFTMADVVVLPYVEGTTSGVIKIAIAFNKPVIATNVGDFPETMKNWSGIVIDQDNLSANIAAAILEIRNNQEQFQNNINKNAYIYQWDNIAKQHFEYLLKA